MKIKFSKAWKASSQKRKKVKYAANAPLHIKKKLVNSNLSKELRKKYGKRSISLRKGDVVRIMRGKFKTKQGKIVSIRLKQSRIEVEGIQTKKMDGSKVNVSLRPSNLQIIELNTEDPRRKLKQKTEEKNVPKETKSA